MSLHRTIPHGHRVDLAAARQQTAGKTWFGWWASMRRIFMIVLGGIAAAMPQAHADTRDDIRAGIERCGVIHDNKVWLDCVYGAIQPMRSQLGLQPAPEFQQRLVPPAPAAYIPPPPATVPMPQ